MSSTQSDRSAVICAFKRSPMHFANKGALAGIRPDDMAAEVVKALVSSSGVKPEDIEDLIMGCAFPEAEQGFNIARLVVNHADRLLRDPLETTVVNVDNPHVLLPQLCAAIAELPESAMGLTGWFGSQTGPLCQLLLERRWVRDRRGTLHWTAEQRGASLVDLRGSGRGPVRITDRETGRSRGFGFVTFAQASDAEEAMSLDGTELDGRRIKVSVAREKRPRW